MAHRLEETTRKIVWSETYTSGVHIGYHDCGVCEKETPPPTHSQLLEFVKHCRYENGTDGGYMWPSDVHPGCNPPGWTRDIEHGLICVECTTAKSEALSVRTGINRGAAS